jgi:glycosyltransferase involved in cell wall biosynthesis
LETSRIKENEYEMKILLLTQDIKGKGGVGNYYNVLKDKFTVDVDLFITGARIDEKGRLQAIHRFLSDYQKFNRIVKRYDIVHINTSLKGKSFVRDALYSLRSKRLGRKTIVFFHGWNSRFCRTLDRYLLWLFRWIFFHAEAIIILSKDFKQTLEGWGYKGRVYLLSTFVDESFCDFDIKQIVKQRSARKELNILFLARLQKEKGIFEAIKTAKILMSKYPHIRLTVAGDGPEYINAVNLANSLGLHRIDFLGFVRGKAKKKAFQNADFYLFPTFYGEGMPTSLIEAMASGLPIISRPVGGIKDMFIQGKMGYLVDSLHPMDHAEALIRLIEDDKLRKSIMMFNHEYVKEHLVAGKILTKLENIYYDIFPESAY